MVKDGTIQICAAEWPAFLYDQKQYNPKYEETGILKGEVLVQVCFSLLFNICMLTFQKAFRHIFTGPSSAICGRSESTKPSKAQLHGLTAVTARTIAYAAVQVLHSFFHF
jgi:hypothetical protein